MNKTTDICANCGLERREHHHDGAAYGVCGQFSEVAHGPPATGTRWRHLKRNTTYYVVGIAKLQTALAGELADETPMVVYANAANDKLSVRSVEEFCDGRFEQLK